MALLERRLPPGFPQGGFASGPTRSRLMIGSLLESPMGHEERPSSGCRSHLKRQSSGSILEGSSQSGTAAKALSRSSSLQKQHKQPVASAAEGTDEELLLSQRCLGDRACDYLVSQLSKSIGLRRLDLSVCTPRSTLLKLNCIDLRRAYRSSFFRHNSAEALGRQLSSQLDLRF